MDPVVRQNETPKFFIILLLVGNFGAYYVIELSK